MLIVDNFAGGGGASVGIEMATGRPVDIAINHDPMAILMHKTNHRKTKHFCEDVWQVNPYDVTKGQTVAFAWFSPDCKHHSKAKGGKPVDKQVRGLAWVMVKWALFVKPNVMILENVEEFKDWCPIHENKPIKERKGETFKIFIEALRENGYEVKYKELRASDFGVPTSRKRLFLIARRDGKKIEFPEPTHGSKNDIDVILGLKKPYVEAHEIIDFTIESTSIFDRKKELAENTKKRIARGIKKFIINSKEPFIIDNKAMFLSHYYTAIGTETRGSKLTDPLPTITTANRFALVEAYLEEYVGNIKIPKDGLYAFLLKYYGNDTGQSLKVPLHTITTVDKFALITVKNKRFRITDIRMRMLAPRELYDSMGFPKDYRIETDYRGKKYSKKQQVARCGNAVCPALAKVIIQANVPELCTNSVLKEYIEAI